jgi:hypothetical protein
MGIEPTAQAWEAWVLPLYDARPCLILVAFGPSGQLASRFVHPPAAEHGPLDLDIEPAFRR